MGIWIRIIPTSSKRPTPKRYTLSHPAGAFRFEQGLLYDVEEATARYVCKNGLLDGDPNTPPVFEQFASEEDARRRVAEEKGMLPAMMSQEAQMVRDETPELINPTSSRAIKPPVTPTQRDVEANATASAHRRRKNT